MKECWTILVILFGGFSLPAQNWKPIESGDTYLYYKQGHAFDSTAVCMKADTIAAFGPDSVAELNRALQRYSGNTFIWSPGFLLDRIIYGSDGTFLCQGNNSYRFMPYQPLNLPWLFDTVNNVSATITSEGVQMVFGNSDSVKTISLSTGDSIVLSMNYGIISFGYLGTYYSLAGIKGRNAGIQLPDIYTMLYTIQPGDIHEYYYIESQWSSYYLDPQHNFDSWKHTRDSLISKSIVGDWLFLDYYRIYKDSIDPNSGPLYISCGAGNYTQGFHIGGISACTNPLNNTTGLSNPGYPDTANYISFDTNAVFSCRTTVWNNLYVDRENYLGGDTIPFIYNIPQGQGALTGWGVFGDSIGLIYSESTDLGDPMSSGSWKQCLTYARINGVEYGTPNSNLHVTVREDVSGRPLKLFPNPTDGLLHVGTDQYFENVFVTDVLGNVCLIFSNVKTGVLDVTTLAPGVYFLNFGNGTTARFVKQ